MYIYMIKTFENLARKISDSAKLNIKLNIIEPIIFFILMINKYFIR